MEGLAVLECLPSDDNDSRYTKSFAAGAENSTEMLKFFREYGFVVIRDVFTATECDNTRQAMWSILESSNPGFKHDDQSTWMNLKSKGSYGLSLRGPSFHPVLVNNRQNPKLAAALDQLVHMDEEETGEADSKEDGPLPDLMVSQDRFAVYRATKLQSADAGSGEEEDGSSYSTGERNIHLDMNPWWWLESSEDILRGVETLQYPYAHSTQPQSTTAVENATGAAADSAAASGAASLEAPSSSSASSTTAGTASAPSGDETTAFLPADAPQQPAKTSSKKSKKAKQQQEGAGTDYPDFIRENNHVVRCMGRHVQCVLNFLDNVDEDGGTLVVPKFHTYLPEFCAEFAHLRRPLPWVQFPGEVEAQLLRRAHRVTMRQGSVLIWDQRLAHGTAPNSSRNCRMAQYLKAFPRSATFPRTPIPAGAKGEAVERGVAVSGREQSVVSARLLRRSTALDALLRQYGARELVTPLGEGLFGLDALK